MIKTAYAFKKYMNDAVCELFISDRWNELNRCAFLTVKQYNPKIIDFQQLLVKEKNPYENNSLEEITRSPNVISIDVLNSVDFV